MELNTTCIDLPALTVYLQSLTSWLICLTHQLEAIIYVSSFMLAQSASSGLIIRHYTSVGPLIFLYFTLSLLSFASSFSHLCALSRYGFFVKTALLKSFLADFRPSPSVCFNPRFTRKLFIYFLSLLSNFFIPFYLLLLSIYFRVKQSSFFFLAFLIHNFFLASFISTPRLTTLRYVSHNPYILCLALVQLEVQNFILPTITPNSLN